MSGAKGFREPRWETWNGEHVTIQSPEGSEDSAIPVCRVGVLGVGLSIGTWKRQAEKPRNWSESWRSDIDKIPTAVRIYC